MGKLTPNGHALSSSAIFSSDRVSASGVDVALYMIRLSSAANENNMQVLYT